MKMPRRLTRAAVCLVAALIVQTATAQAADKFKPNGMFGDNMVLQQEIKIPVWGVGADGQKVVVTLGDTKADTVVKDGFHSQDDVYKGVK